MLVLGRRKNERIRIGDDIVVVVVSVDRKLVRIGIDAPRDIAIVRDELPPLPGEPDATTKENCSAA